MDCGLCYLGSESTCIEGSSNGPFYPLGWSGAKCSLWDEYSYYFTSAGAEETVLEQP